MNLGVCIFWLALAAPPSELESWIERAVQAKESGDLDGALVALERALAIRPHYKLRHNQAKLLESLGRYREAALAYRGVLDDPAAPPELLADDRAALLALGPALELAFVEVELRPAGTVTIADRLIEGRVGLAPGRSSLEARTATVVQLSSVLLPAGTTTRLRLRLNAEARGRRAVLRLDPSGRSSSLLVDDSLVRGALGGTFQELWLDPGPHRLAVHGPDGERNARLALEAGASVLLSTVFPEPIKATPLARSSLSLSAVGVGILGGALAATAAGLYLSANADRRSIRSAPTEDGVVQGLTMRAAQDLEDQAQAKTTWGAVSAGAALLSGALALLLGLAGAP